MKLDPKYISLLLKVVAGAGAAAWLGPHVEGWAGKKPDGTPRLAAGQGAMAVAAAFVLGGLMNVGGYGRDLLALSLGAVGPIAQVKIMDAVQQAQAPKVSGYPFHVGQLPSGAAMWIPQHAQLYHSAGFPVS